MDSSHEKDQSEDFEWFAVNNCLSKKKSTHVVLPLITLMNVFFQNNCEVLINFFWLERYSDGVNMVCRDLKEKQNQEQLTIFYDGKVSVCDVTELQVIFITIYLLVTLSILI